MIKRLYHERHLGFQVLSSNKLDPFFLESSSLLTDNIHPTIRPKILLYMDDLIKGINDLITINPERKERINSFYLDFIVFCLSELNIAFLLAKVARHYQKIKI
jgi:hypothetical protein